MNKKLIIILAFIFGIFFVASHYATKLIEEREGTKRIKIMSDTNIEISKPRSQK